MSDTPTPSLKGGAYYGDARDAPHFIHRAHRDPDRIVFHFYQRTHAKKRFIFPLYRVEKHELMSRTHPLRIDALKETKMRSMPAALVCVCVERW